MKRVKGHLMCVKDSDIQEFSLSRDRTQVFRLGSKHLWLHWFSVLKSRPNPWEVSLSLIVILILLFLMTNGVECLVLYSLAVVYLVW